MSVLQPALNRVELIGSTGEEASSETSVGATAVTVNRSAGATEIEVYVLSGFVNVRSDGSAATATTGRPVGAGFSLRVAAATISLFRYGSVNATVRLVNGVVA
jgi:ferric-dicitrate binding protein FerR (iron transport regulator)